MDRSTLPLIDTNYIMYSRRYPPLLYVYVDYTLYIKRNPACIFINEGEQVNTIPDDEPNGNLQREPDIADLQLKNLAESILFCCCANRTRKTRTSST